MNDIQTTKNSTLKTARSYTRKHFELVAEVIASVADVDTRKVLCEEWSLKLAKTNRRFNFGTFAKACDVSEMDLRGDRIYGSDASGGTLREPLWMEELANSAAFDPRDSDAVADLKLAAAHPELFN
jgi:hypothetical protein